MADFTVIEARPWHCGQMARMLRDPQQRAVRRLGVDSHRELRARFNASTFRRAWLIDGKLAALGGVTGSRLAAEGLIWLAFSENATRYKVEMIKEARRQLQEISSTKPRLVTTVLEGDDAAKRFAIFLGFAPLDENNRANSRFGRLEMMRRIASADRDEYGSVGLVYLPEAA